MKVVVLVSGGMDSVTALYQAHRDHEVIAGLSFDYGSKHNHREIPFAASHCKTLGVRHEVISLGFMNDLFKSDLLRSGGEIPEGHYEASNMKKTVVPFRNGIMLSIAAGYAESIEAEGLVIAAHSGDHAIYADCREEFMAPMAEAIAQGTDVDLQVLRPFIEMRKEDIAAAADELGLDLADTWSCYKGGEIHCGKCGTCVERKEAFLLAKLIDGTVYEG
ncbi:MAG: 7-cyano-7-deazaguanine synthase QueC [Verrucomicrobiales bacterium]|nr:7-cyano-7-deazaguanine synthase QueC [Verrucomicrobiales bacterium]